MPDAILLQDVETLGEQGNVVDVSKGYLRNYLMPRKLAQPATKGAVEAIRQRQEAAERAERLNAKSARDQRAGASCRGAPAVLLVCRPYHAVAETWTGEPA